jgi:hypothetical protein
VAKFGANTPFRNAKRLAPARVPDPDEARARHHSLHWQR